MSYVFKPEDFEGLQHTATHLIPAVAARYANNLAAEKGKSKEVYALGTMRQWSTQRIPNHTHVATLENVQEIEE